MGLAHCGKCVLKLKKNSRKLIIIYNQVITSVIIDENLIGFMQNISTDIASLCNHLLYSRTLRAIAVLRLNFKLDGSRCILKFEQTTKIKVLTYFKILSDDTKSLLVCLILFFFSSNQCIVKLCEFYILKI